MAKDRVTGPAEVRLMLLAGLWVEDGGDEWAARVRVGVGLVCNGCMDDRTSKIKHVT